MQISIEMVLGAYMCGRTAEGGAFDELASCLILSEMISGKPSDLTLQLMKKMGTVLLEQANAPKA